MILRRDPEHGASLLSIPRDLWVPIAGTGDDGKINCAYNGGPRRLVETITQALGIPIHHYIEVDFAGFKQLVDAIGGVEMCVDTPPRTSNRDSSCSPAARRSTAAMALAYARSRHYEEFIDGEWRAEDGAPDLGRIERQQNFLRIAAAAMLARGQLQPVPARRPDRAAGDVVRLDSNST